MSVYSQIVNQTTLKIKDRHWKQPTIFEYYILGHVAFIWVC